MGQIIIEIEQGESRSFRVRNEQTVKKLLKVLEQIVDREREEEDDILGLWTTPEPIKKAARQK